MGNCNTKENENDSNIVFSESNYVNKNKSFQESDINNDNYLQTKSKSNFLLNSSHEQSPSKVRTQTPNSNENSNELNNNEYENIDNKIFIDEALDPFSRMNNPLYKSNEIINKNMKVGTSINFTIVDSSNPIQPQRVIRESYSYLQNEIIKTSLLNNFIYKKYIKIFHHYYSLWNNKTKGNKAKINLMKMVKLVKFQQTIYKSNGEFILNVLKHYKPQNNRHQHHHPKQNTNFFSNIINFNTKSTLLEKLIQKKQLKHAFDILVLYYY